MGKWAKLSAVQQVVWGAAIRASGLPMNTIIIPVTKELKEQIVKQSRRRVHDLAKKCNSKPCEELWLAITFFSERTTGRRFMMATGDVFLGRLNPGGQADVGNLSGPSYVLQQLKKAARIQDVDCPCLHVTTQLLSRCLRDYCRPWCKNNGGVDSYYAAVLALHLTGKLSGNVVRLGRGGGIVEGWWHKAAASGREMGWLPEAVDDGHLMRCFEELGDWGTEAHGGEATTVDWACVLRVVENPYRGALERRPFFTDLERSGAAVKYPFSRCNFGELWQKNTFLLIWSEGGAFKWTPPPLCRFDCHACYLCKATGHMRHKENLGNEQGHSMYKKHRLPLPMVESVLDGNGLVQAAPGEWGINLFCGTDSIEPVYEERGYGYVGVDLFGAEGISVKAGGRVVARLLLDIGAVTLGGLLERVYHVTGLRGGGLRFVWASPPCDTYSRMDTTNGSYHRDWEGAAEGAPCSLEAQLADTLLIHLFAMLS
jgi:hypothetical protein